MSETALRVSGVAVALVGAAVTAYLLYARYADASIVCATGGCETVQSSHYAEVLGVPVAGLGLLGFLTLAAAAALRGELARTVQAVVALAAAAFSAYLLYVQLGVIGETCDWCLLSDGVLSVITVLALLRLKNA